MKKERRFFVTLFFVVQFFGDLEYTRLTQCLGIQTGIMKIIYVLSILLSLSFALGKKKSIFAHIN